MRIPLALLALAVSAAPHAADAAYRDNGRGEAELQKAVAGGLPGKPVDCLNLLDIQSSRIIDRTAILYESRGILYVNRPRSGAETLSGFGVLVTDTHSSELCSTDIVRLFDPTAHMQTGFVGLGLFVPYRKPPRQH
jgi:hypothetical protein